MFDEIIKNLKANDPTLIEVNLHGTTLTKLQVWQLALALRKNTVVNSVILSQTELSVEHLEVLLISLAENKKITSLDLSNNPLDDKRTGKLLQNFLLANKQLAELYLNGTGVSDETGRVLIKALDQNIFLQNFDFLNNTLSPLIYNQLVDKIAMRLIDKLNQLDTENYHVAVKWIKTQKYKSFAQDVLARLANFLANNKGKNADAVLQRFGIILQSAPRDMVGLAHQELIIRCLKAMNCDERFPELPVLLNEIVVGLNNNIFVNEEKSVVVFTKFRCELNFLPQRKDDLFRVEDRIDGMLQEKIYSKTPILKAYLEHLKKSLIYNRKHSPAFFEVPSERHEDKANRDDEFVRSVCSEIQRIHCAVEDLIWQFRIQELSATVISDLCLNLLKDSPSILNKVGILRDWVRRLEKGDVRCKLDILNGLNKLGTVVATSEIFEVLHKLLTHERDDMVRMAVIKVLSEISSIENAELINILGRWIECEFSDRGVQIAAIDALRNLGVRGSKQSVAILCKFTKNSNSDIKRQAIKALRLLNAKQHPLIADVLLEIANNSKEKWSIRLEAIEALGNIGFAEDHRVVTLFDYLLSEYKNSDYESNLLDPYLTTTAELLGRIGSRGNMLVVNFLYKLLEEDRAEVYSRVRQEDIILALAEIGEHGNPGVVEFLCNEVNKVNDMFSRQELSYFYIDLTESARRDYCVKALSRIAPKNQRAVKFLCELVEKEKNQGRRHDYIRLAFNNFDIAPPQMVGIFYNEILKCGGFKDWEILKRIPFRKLLNLYLQDTDGIIVAVHLASCALMQKVAVVLYRGKLLVHDSQGYFSFEYSKQQLPLVTCLTQAFSKQAKEYNLLIDDYEFTQLSSQLHSLIKLKTPLEPSQINIVLEYARDANDLDPPIKLSN